MSDPTPPEPQPSGAASAESDELVAEKKKLKTMQEQTHPMALQVAREALAVMMSMGWRFDAHFTRVTDPKTGKEMAVPALVIRALELGEWQEVQKEKVRKQFLA
jgi:hypothetical protein